MKAPHVVAAGCVAVTLAHVTSCIDDLDLPTMCPAAPRFAGASCRDALVNPPPGCLTYNATKATPEKVACLTGPRDDCRCTSADCPPDDDGACYPDGDCPRAVRDRASDATCKRLLPEDVGADLPTDSMCMCMCAGCAAVCDGVGPVVGVSTTPMAQPYPILFEFGRRMPDRGRLGLYMRVRGLANVRITLYKGDAGDLKSLTPIDAPTYIVVNELSTDFKEQVLYTDEFLGMHAYEWHTAADKPTVAAVWPTIDPTMPAAALFELDCLVPFVVAL